MSQTYCITVENVYGKPLAELKAPQGWEFTGEFRPGKTGETVMGNWSWEGFRACEMGNVDNEKDIAPRLILRKLPPKPTVESVYAGKSLGEMRKVVAQNHPGFELTGEFRAVRAGDKFLSSHLGSSVLGPDEDGLFVGEYRLIMRKLLTIKDIYGRELSELTIPAGWRATGEFRIPAMGESFLGIDRTERKMYEGFYGADGPKPRLILEKIPPTPTIKEVYGTDTPAVPAGWKIKEFRQVADYENVVVLTGLNAREPLTASVMRFGSYFCNGWRLVLEPDLSQFKWTTGPEFIYGEVLPEVPEGYKVIAFRPPKKGEFFINVFSSKTPVNASIDYYQNHPRLILQTI